jgi:hypothetical protein
MNEASIIKDCIFVRIVRRTRPDQSFDQSALSRSSTPRDEDRSPAPADDPRVQEKVLLCEECDCEVEVRLEISPRFRRVQ